MTSDSSDNESISADSTTSSVQRQSGSSSFGSNTITAGIDHDNPTSNCRSKEEIETTTLRIQMDDILHQMQERENEVADLKLHIKDTLERMSVFEARPVTSQPSATGTPVNRDEEQALIEDSTPLPSPNSSHTQEGNDMLGTQSSDQDRSSNRSTISSTNTDPPTTPTSTNNTSSSWRGIRNSGLFQRLISTRQQEEHHQFRLKYTGTVHIFAVAYLADAVRASSAGRNQNIISKKNRTSWKFTSLSFFVVILQLLVLSFVINTPTSSCSAHTDCPTGSFCKAYDLDDYSMTKPRCATCSLVGFLETVCNGNWTADIPYWEVQNIDETILWFDKEGNANYGDIPVTFPVVFQEGYNFITSVEDERYKYLYTTERVYLYCLASKHCYDTAPAGVSYNSYYELKEYFRETSENKENDSRPSVFELVLLFFIAILLGCTVTKELIEVAIEEATLNKMNGSRLWSPYLCERLLRLSLQLRQLILPWFVSGATMAVLVSDILSIKNVLLNFLAVSFLIEADNMLVRFLYSSEEFVENTLFKEDGINDMMISTSWQNYIGAMVVGSVLGCFILGNSILEHLIIYQTSINGHITGILWIAEKAKQCTWQREVLIEILEKICRVVLVWAISSVCILLPSLYADLNETSNLWIPFLVKLCIATFLIQVFGLCIERELQFTLFDYELKERFFVICFLVTLCFLVYAHVRWYIIVEPVYF